MTHTDGGTVMTDWGGMESAPVADVVRPHDEDTVIRAVRRAAERGMRVSVRGAGHSAGGQSFSRGGLVVDVRDLRQIVQLDPASRVVRVQTGATWGDLTPQLEAAGLGVTTKQEFETFTIGGSIAANVHGKSLDHGPLIEAIRSFRLLRANGDVVTVSRHENADFFPAVVGGYGLFGIVLDVTLEVIPDPVVEKTEVVRMTLDALVERYAERVRSTPRPVLCYGFLDPTAREGFYLTYTEAPDGTPRPGRRQETNPYLFDAIVWLQRQLAVARAYAFELLWHSSGGHESVLRSRRLLLWDHMPRSFDAMLLQKYVVPVEQFASFARAASRILTRHDLHLLTSHFRFVPGNDEALLSLAPQDAICLIPCYLADKRDPAWVERLRRATGELLEAVLERDGRHYLTFDALATREQLRRGYPRVDEFFALKRRHDPDARFSSLFYERYGRDTADVDAPRIGAAAAR